MREGRAMNRNLVALLAFVLVSLPATAFAASATITVFEAKVHASPDRSSPVIHTFTENTRVSVSEEATNGFRRVRLPSGRVGYIDETAISLGGAEAQPPTPPPAEPPPPPTFAPPPPPPSAPPPGGYRYPPYRRVYYADPTAFRHLGLFLRLDLGLGYMDSSTSANRTFFTFDSSHGVAGEFALAVGGAVKENFIVAGELWTGWVPSPTLTSRGLSVPTGSTFSNALVGIGPNFTWYLMPTNVFLSVTPSLTWVNFSDVFASYTTDVGFGTRFALGKEWWVAPHWGIGVSGWFLFSFNREGGGADATWRTFAGGLGFSATLN
jgi:hypothetical protein